jgi:hypothetical protein
VSNCLEHFLGESAAAVPAAHITMKVEPIRGFRRKSSAGTFGGNAIINNVVNRPNSETNSANFTMNGGFVSVFMHARP